jgi:hypothetical protein
LFVFLTNYLYLDSCQLFGQFKSIVRVCTEGLSSKTQEKSSFGLGWSQFNQSYIPPNGYQSIYNAFQFKDPNTLQGSSIQGKYATYDGSGYLYELRGKLDYIQGNLSLLKEMQWIDRQTRAVFIEFSSFNPNINLIMVSTILVEFLPFGDILTTARFDPLNLFAESKGISFKIIAEIIFMSFIVYYMISQIRCLYKRGILKYLSDFWSYIEWSIISTAWVSFFMTIYRLIVALKVLDFFKRTSGYGYMKLQSVNESNQILTYSLGLCVAFATIKFLKMLRFNKHISYLGLTLKNCFNELASFSMVFFLVWFAFVQLIYLIYSCYLDGYSTLTRSSETAFIILLGKFSVDEYIQHYPLLGPIIFSTYNIVMLFFVLNIFISIITESFYKVRLNSKENPKSGLDFWDHAKKKLRNLFKKKNNLNKPKYHDRFSLFPRRVDQLTNFVIQVN